MFVEMSNVYRISYTLGEIPFYDRVRIESGANSHDKERILAF